MAKFCNKCGKPLINGQTCNCQNKKINIIKVIPVVFTLMLIAAAVAIYIFNKNNRNNESNSVYSSETETVTAEETTENTESTNKEKNYFWYLKPAVEADELYTYDFEALDYADYMGEKNDVYDWFAVIKKDGFYNIVDYNGKQYLTEKYTDYFEHACVGIMLDKAEGEEVTDDYTRDYNADSEYNNEWADKNLTIWYNSDIKKIEFIKGGSSTQGHGGTGESLFVIENNELIMYFQVSGDVLSEGLEYAERSNTIHDNILDKETPLSEYNKKYAVVVADINTKKYGLYFNNELIVPYEYKQYYDDYFIWLGTDDDKWYLYNKNGVKIFDFPCKSVSANNYLVSDHFGNHYDGGIYMENGGRVPYLCTENKLAVYNDNGCAYFGTDGSQITDYGEFEEIRPVHNNLAWVKKDGKWGVIQFNGHNTYVTPEIAEKSGIVTEAEIKNTEKSNNTSDEYTDSELRKLTINNLNDGEKKFLIYDGAEAKISAELLDESGITAFYASLDENHYKFDQFTLKLDEPIYVRSPHCELGSFTEINKIPVFNPDFEKLANQNVIMEGTISLIKAQSGVSYYFPLIPAQDGCYIAVLEVENYTLKNSGSDNMVNSTVDDNINNNNNNNDKNNNDNNASAEYATGYVNTDDGDELFVRSSPEIINSPGKGNKFDCFPNGTALNINLSKSVDDWYYVTGIGLSGNTATGYVSKQFVVIN